MKTFHVLRSIQSKSLIVLAVSALAFVASCKKESEPIAFERQFGKEFYPTKSRTYRDYRVDSAYFNQSVGPDTMFSTFYLREVTDTIINRNTRDTTYLVKRYIKRDSSLGWPGTVTQNYSVTALPEGILRVEENVPILALRYPFRIGTTWNGNQYNSIGGQEQTFRAESFTMLHLGTQHLDSVLTVVEKRDSTCLDKTYIYSRYARGIGPIERYRNIFEYVQDPQNPCGEPRVVRRVNRYSQRLIGYGTL